MAAYEYTALDAGGREQRGVLEGDSPRQIRQLLREKQWLPLQVLPVSGDRRDGSTTESGARRVAFSWRASIKAADVALLTRQLATLVRAAVPLEESLRAVAEQSERPAVQKVLAAVRSRVIEGHTLAHALGEIGAIELVDH